MCNLHIKETEISQKRSKGIKNLKITYSVILSVLSNKTNLILGFSSPLMCTSTYHKKQGNIFNQTEQKRNHEPQHERLLLDALPPRLFNFIALFLELRLLLCPSPPTLRFDGRAWQSEGAQTDQRSDRAEDPQCLLPSEPLQQCGQHGREEHEAECGAGDGDARCYGDVLVEELGDDGQRWSSDEARSDADHDAISEEHVVYRLDQRRCYDSDCEEDTSDELCRPYAVSL